jgi:hypothetical protein
VRRPNVLGFETYSMFSDRSSNAIATRRDVDFPDAFEREALLQT